MWQSLVESYIGINGLLDVHRKKAIGFMEITLQAGEHVTSSGVSAKQDSVASSPWSKLNSDFGYAMTELRSKFSCPYSQLNKQDKIADDVYDVTLSTNTHMPHATVADHIRIAPKNATADYIKIIRELNPNLGVTLNSTWSDHFAQQSKYKKRVAFRLFLQEADLNLSVSAVARLFELANLSGHEKFISADSYNLNEFIPLLKRIRSDILAEEIAALVQPLAKRAYTVTSVETPNDITVTVKQVGKHKGCPYSVSKKEFPFPGVTSSYLTRQKTKSAYLNVELSPNLYFRPPIDPTTPIIVIAGGSGINTFVNMFRKHRGEMLLLFSTRNSGEHYHYESVIEKRNILPTKSYVIHSQPAENDTGARVGRINRLIESVPVSENINELIHKKAYIYVCGSSEFEECARKSLEKITQQSMRQRIVDRQYLLNVSSQKSNYEKDEIKLSELAKHNNPSLGYWTVVEDKVYNLTGFIAEHIGGDKIIRLDCGTDGTENYRVIHKSGCVADSWLPMHQMGYVNRKNYQDPVCSKIVTHLEAVVRLQNNFSIDTDYMNSPIPFYLLRDSFRIFVVNSLQPIIFVFQNEFNSDYHRDLPDYVSTLGQRLFSISAKFSDCLESLSASREIYAQIHAMTKQFIEDYKRHIISALSILELDSAKTDRMYIEIEKSGRCVCKFINDLTIFSDAYIEDKLLLVKLFRNKQVGGMQAQHLFDNRYGITLFQAQSNNAADNLQSNPVDSNRSGVIPLAGQ